MLEQIDAIGNNVLSTKIIHVKPVRTATTARPLLCTYRAMMFRSTHNQKEENVISNLLVQWTITTYKLLTIFIK